MNNSKNSKALTIANALVRQGVSSVGQPLRHFVPPPPLGKTRSEAMRRAWRTVKQRVIHTNTAGVTRGNRQTLLYRLTRYSADLISVTLRREPENAADKNAVQVIAAVKGKGSAVMGYLNRQLAEAIAPKQSVAGRSSTRASRYSPSSRQLPEARRRSSITGST